MIDQFGRNINYLRISVTDRCNFRCVYCMPENGVEQLSHDDILRYDEIIRIVKTLSKLGIKNIKITGGEPLVRKDICSLICDLKDISGIDEVTLTTNGYLLESMADDLHNARVDAINVSLDTLDSEEFNKITRVDALDSVIRGIDKVLEYPDIRLKVNVVLSSFRKNIISVASLAETRPIDVRFIELMPIGASLNFKGSGEKELVEALIAKYGNPTAVTKKLGNGPSKYVHFKDMKGNIGLISSISDKFCSKCNRIRLTSDGYLKQCLHTSGGVDIRGLIRSGTSDEKLLETMRSVIYNKPEGHQFENSSTEKSDGLYMNILGG